MSGGSKLGVVGAGAVGSSLAYAALLRGSAREIALYDVQAAKVEAEVLDLAHGAQHTGSATVAGGSDIGVLADSDVVVITAGARQRPGQSRLDLAAINVGLLESMMPALLSAAPDAVYVLVTNPADVLTVAAQRFSGLPASRVLSTGTVLDSSRLRWRLGIELGVATSSVHAVVLGEHGDSQFPFWSAARIGPIPLQRWLTASGRPLRAADLAALATEVRKSAARVIAGKGATNYAIGVAAARVVEAVLRDERTVLPVSSVLDGYRGLHGIALSMPSLVGAGGVSDVLPVDLDEDEVRRLTTSAEAVEATLHAVGLA